MNFTLVRDSVSRTDHSLDGPTTASVLVKDDRMDNITSIVDSFENDTFLGNYGKNVAGIVGVDVNRQLSDLLLWLNSDFVPCILNEVRNNDIKQINEHLKYAKLIRQKFGKICKFIKNSKQGKLESNYTFVCTTCQQVIPSPVAAHASAWRSLQQHEHIEENLFNSIMSKTTSRHNVLTESLNLTSDSSVPNFMTSTNNRLSVSEKPNVFAVSSSSSSNDKYESPTNSSDSQKSSTDLSKQATNCESCSCAKNDAINFKFNFCVGYNPMIEKKLYLNAKFPKQVKEMDGLGQHTIQFKGSQLFSCLLCCCDVPSNVTFRTVKEHIAGHRHTKRKSSASSVAALVAYHQNWMKYEAKYQAHQINFVPKNKSETLCYLCGVVVAYDLLENHIIGEPHKEQVLNVHRRDKSSLVHLQVAVYTNENVVLNDHSDESEEAANGTMHRSNQRLFANMDKAGSDTDESDTNTTVEDKKSNSEPTTSKTDKQLATAKAKQKSHIVIKSIANPSGTDLRDLLEHRFLPHLEAVMTLSDAVVECHFCRVKMPKDPAVMKEHILSNAHKTKSNVPHVPYHFYCEICGILFKQNLQWLDHMKQPKHVERCEKLGASRKNKLTEYECMTCKAIIFGDDLSVKRHITANLRGIRYRKNKEIILGEPVKAIFKSEKSIKEQSKQLIAEANQVLSKQDQLQKCCLALEAALADAYPKCKVYPFGSRVSGLGSEKSDLDVFVDVGGMYMGQKDQDSRSQEKFVVAACKSFRKKKEEFSHVNPIPTARTPIVQVYHLSTRLDCDLSFRHGLSVENTKFLKLCIQLQPVTQPMILLLKHWLEQCKLHENITTYALSMMVIFFLQVKKHLMPVHELGQFSSGNVTEIDGWKVVDFATINVRDRVVPYTGSMKQLLMEFFYYYSCFSYTTDVICPLLGRSTRKSFFIDKPKEELPPEMLSYVQKLSSADSEQFRARSPFCIQDPFDLSHNLAKACTYNLVEKLKTLCDLTVKYLRISG